MQYILAFLRSPLGRVVFLMGIWCLGGMRSPVLAQEAGALLWFPEQIASQAWQPAHLAAHPFAEASIGGLGRYQIQSSHLRVASLFPAAGLLDEADKNQIISELDTDNRLHVGLGLPLYANVRMGRLPLGLSFQYRDAIFGQVGQASTIALVLKGNAPFAGETLADDGLGFQRASWNKVGLSSAWMSEDERLRMGVQLNLLLGTRFDRWNNASFSLNTAPLGVSIDLTAAYDQFTRQTGTAQLGAGLDFGLYFKVNDKLDLQASLQDLGFIRWQGYGRSVNMRFAYEGVEATNILSGEFGIGTDIVVLDSLEELLFPDSTNQTQAWATPAQVMLGGRYSLTERDAVFLNLHVGFSQESPLRPRPRAQVGYLRSLGTMLKVGLHGYVGSLDRIGLGGIIQGDFTLADRVGVRLFAQTQNALGWLAPTTTRGFGASGGLTISLLDKE